MTSTGEARPPSDPGLAREGRILLVEDKEGLRNVLRKTLEDEGFQVESCADGAEALQQISRQRFLLVLTDLKLPHADGLRILKAARQSDSALPVIVMTAFGTVQDAVSAMKEGAYDFLETTPE